MDEFWEITEDLRRDDAAEQVGVAREILAAGVAGSRFADHLRRVPAGEVVTIALADGALVRGRILRVGLDWLRLGEVAVEEGAGRARLRRCHDVRIEAVVRIVRDPAP